MKLHGKTKIILYDVKRNIKHITESENTFQTQVLADYFRSYGEEDCNPFRAGSYDGTNLWKNAFGGIFLFKNQETAGNKFATLGNKMVGNGSYGIANTGAPSELGSFNEDESGISADNTQIIQTYDWGTSQANDTIRCVCLTSRVGGYIGYGNSSGNTHSTNVYNFYSLQDTRGVINFNTASACGNFVYEVSGDFSDGKIKINKTRRSLITGNPFCGVTETLKFDLSTVGDGYGISGRTESFGCYKFFDIGGGIFRFIPTYSGGKSVAPNASVYYYEFDATNETLTQKYFTNTSSSTLLVSHTETETTSVYFYENYAICLVGLPTQGGYTAEVFNITTSVHLKTLNAREISGQNGSAFRRQWTTILDNGFVAFCVRSNETIFMYDTVNGTVYPTNVNYIPHSMWGLYLNSSLGSGIMGRADSQPTQDRTKGLYHNPLYLATINNLPEAIVKDATKTMKIIYTLEIS